jgi:DNA-binding transcriptional LysR family regulator
MSIKRVALGQLTDYELKYLRIFKPVADCKGFSVAAATLNISRPTISIHIAKLEARLNMKLCERGRAGFALTPKGVIVYDQVNKLLESLETFRNTINNISDSPAGQLKVGLSDGLSLDPRCHFSEIVRYFGQMAPDVELITDVDRLDTIEKEVLNGRLDVGFIPYHRQHEGLEYTHLFTDTNYLYCGRGNLLYDLAENELTDEQINIHRLVHAGLKPHTEMAKLIGKVTTAVLLSFHLDPRNFECARSLQKAMGLNLKEKSSGRYIGQLKLTKRGSSKARMYLYFAALRLIQKDPVVRQWYQSKVNPKAKNKTVIAVMRKLSKALWHVAQGQAFDASELFSVPAKKAA